MHNDRFAAARRRRGRRRGWASAALVASLLALLPASGLQAQNAPEDPPAWAVSLLSTWRWNTGRTLDRFDRKIVGVQLDRALGKHFAAWGSLRHDEVYGACIGEPCVTGGHAVLTGLDVRATDNQFVPYVSMGVGVLRWSDGHTDGMWQIRPGLAFVDIGPFRPWAEVGWERFLTFGLTAGLGIAF